MPPHPWIECDSSHTVTPYAWATAPTPRNPRSGSTPEVSANGVKSSPDITPTRLGASKTSPTRWSGGSCTPIAEPSGSRTHGRTPPASRLPPGQVTTTS